MDFLQKHPFWIHSWKNNMQKCLKSRWRCCRRWSITHTTSCSLLNMQSLTLSRSQQSHIGCCQTENCNTFCSCILNSTPQPKLSFNSLRSRKRLCGLATHWGTGKGWHKVSLGECSRMFLSVLVCTTLHVRRMIEKSYAFELSEEIHGDHSQGMYIIKMP